MRLAPLSSCAALALAIVVLPSHALFKVVAPDGTVTYTDRPPATNAARPAQRGQGAAASDNSAALAALPLELRQTMARFPVTLYSSNDCAPCESGRRMLQGRGVPFTERRVANEDDAEALNRLTGGRSVPTLTIGSQALRGFAESDWQSYLDAAGYPRESLLPRSYQPPPATPLVDRQPEAPAPVARPAAPPAEPIAAPPTTAPSPTGIRF
ncbi:MAG TPA: glutaredoxin family protein [Burkholderiaceae bacterium]